MEKTNLPPHFRPTKPDDPFLLASDIDGTLLGDEQGEAWIKAFVRRYPGSLHLALITGRPVASVMGLLQDDRLPQPDYISGRVGTELVACDDPENRLGDKYAAQVSPDWDLETIYTLGLGDGIGRQEFTRGQPRFQAGFEWDGQPETLAAFRARLAHLDGCHILPSYGRYIDVLPALIGKGDTARFLRRELALDPARVIVAGDSGNDREMFETDFKGILPSNVREELGTVARRPWHYHSPFPAARGVLDGLRHFGFVEWVE